MRCEHRGPILIHAGKTPDPAFDELRRVLREGDIHVPLRKELPRGGIVGRATIVDCVTDYDSAFFTGPYGFVLEEAEPLPFQPCKGRLGIFDL